ncbi:MAG TPA: M20/M25/M40 family metallo-hydrolase [Woeseiaceae bacterium]|jgi:glutamate carboxypeptidase|nr:M20/M25/M40 family metallo-hydrolase [Woeseiaceae bacterium]
MPGRRTLPATLALILLFAGAAGGAGLSNTERQLSAAVDSRQAQAMALLEQAVEINSGTMNLQGVKEVGELFEQSLAELGFDTRWVDGADFGRAGHLVARHGDTGPHLLLIGHLDTVFERDSPFQHFERAGPDRAKGPGIIDMKGGDVVMIEALAALRAVGALDDLEVTVVMMGDEESSGKPLSEARQALLAAADAADVALGFEDGDGNPATAVIARRGYTGWQLVVSGKPAHSSLIFREDIGGGAAFELARILDGFRRELQGERYLTFNPGLVLSGTRVHFDEEHSAGEAFGKGNVIPGRGIASGDLRTLTPDQLDSAKSRMRDVVFRHLRGTSAEIEFTDGYPPLAPTDGNRRLLSLYDRASRDLGVGPVSAVDPGDAGAADISFTAGRVAMALDGLGLMGTGGHTIEETADLGTLPSQTKRAALLMYRLRDVQIRSY